MQAKPVQIAVIVIGLVVGLVGIVLAVSKGGPPKTATSVTLVDVMSGELFDAGTRKRTLVLPMKNPETGERTLIRVGFDEDRDGYYVSNRHLQYLDEFTEGTPFVDRETGRVNVDSDAKRKSL